MSETDRQAEIDARWATAAPWPWEAFEYGTGPEEPDSYRIMAGDRYRGEVIARTPEYSLVDCRNAEAIAHAPADIAWQRERIRELEAERDELRVAAENLLIKCPSSDDMRLLIRVIGGVTPSAEAIIAKYDTIDAARNGVRRILLAAPEVTA